MKKSLSVGLGCLGLVSLAVLGQAWRASAEDSSLVVRHLGTGLYQVQLDPTKEAGQDLYYGVWSEDRGQDDFKFYPVPARGQAGTFNVADHRGTGQYQVYLYDKQGEEFVPLAHTSVQVDRQDYQLRAYYLQSDQRWAWKQYGDWPFWESGCLPTSMSMIYSALAGNVYTPEKVADYLYQNSSQFNKKTIGTTGRGILQASEHFGFKTQVLINQDKLAESLAQGHYVLATLQDELFISDPESSHALVLKGYDNGKTHLTDPWNPENTGWYEISDIFGMASTNVDDLDGLGVPFIQITDA